VRPYWADGHNYKKEMPSPLMDFFPDVVWPMIQNWIVGIAIAVAILIIFIIAFFYSQRQGD
jgi:hypothetical protein